MRRGPAQRVAHRDPLQRRGARDVEHDRVPARGRDLGAVARHGLAPEVRAGVPRRVQDRLRHLLGRDEQLDGPGADEPVVQPALGPHVRPLQVHRGEPRVVPRQVVATTHPLEQPELGQPLDLARAAGRVGREAVEHGRPPVQHVLALRRRGRRALCARAVRTAVRYSRWISSAVRRRPSASSTRVVSVRSWLIRWTAWTGSRSVSRSTIGERAARLRPRRRPAR